MQRLHKYQNKEPPYEFSSEFSENKLNLSIKTQKTQYQLTVSNHQLPAFFEENHLTIQKIFNLLGNMENFDVDHQNGKLHLNIGGSQRPRFTKIQFKTPDQIQQQQELAFDLHFPYLSQLPSKPTTIRNEKSQYDDYDNQMRNFEKKIIAWRQQIIESSKKFKNEINFQFEERNGIWKGTYIGEQSNEKKPNGNGIFVYDFGARLEAEWKNGQRNGKCIYFTSDGNVHVSEYKNGKLNGKQIKYFRDGRRQEQQFCDDFFHGRRRWFNEKSILQREQTWQYDFRTK